MWLYRSQCSECWALGMERRVPPCSQQTLVGENNKAPSKGALFEGPMTHIYIYIYVMFTHILGLKLSLSVYPHLAHRPAGAGSGNALQRSHWPQAVRQAKSCSSGVPQVAQLEDVKRRRKLQQLALPPTRWQDWKRLRGSIQ